ncbi:LacI family DNA-binding transcriptional regulator [Buttiauxella selenatireducens]|uniref:LacI family DNA-binding transcriptional regulator n=1 Tax=Buttiauxella selenatireducens TaxID=3073902 RepID=A0ABY9SCY6_9ENTR|nr:LacI family DNA-binding transcriptional regulator [Buttiauxella sp. R73]WMY75026.1 LacI family DNA-binding transcriptional regulator [Buttiauxella sp. R73]
MTGKLKIKQIAELTGLSPSTVSRVLAGKTNVSAQAKEKVFFHARAMGILRDIPSSRLLMSSLLICAPAAAFTPHGDHYYYEVIQGIISEVSRFDVHVKKCSLDINDADISLFMKSLSHSDVEGIIIIGIDDDSLYRLASESHKPVVTINARDKKMRLDCVSPDHYSIGYSAANYLADKGHRSALLFTDLRRETMVQRLEGFKRACQDRHLIFDESEHLLVTKGYGEPEARQNFKKYLQQRSKAQLPSAILCGGGAIARAVISELKHHNIQMPDDISIMTCAYAHEMEEIKQLGLTAAFQPCCELGVEAVYILQSRLTRNVSPRFNLLLQGSIHVGNSVADVNWRRRELYQSHQIP